MLLGCFVVYGGFRGSLQAFREWFPLGGGGGLLAVPANSSSVIASSFFSVGSGMVIWRGLLGLWILRWD